jgi:beta-glucanase (GH16 family)
MAAMRMNLPAHGAALHWRAMVPALFFSLMLSSQGAPPSGYKLVWQEEFNGTQLDDKKWKAMDEPRKGGFSTPKAVKVANGLLTLTTFTDAGKHYTGFITGRGKYEAAYGYFEARIRFFTSPGEWGAFWVTSPTIGKPLNDPAKAGTEIDIVEHRIMDQKGTDLSRLMAINLHWDGYGKDHKSAGGKGAPPANAPSLQGNWHVYALLWTPDEYVFHLDGVEQWRTKQAVSKRPQYILLTCEIKPEGWAGKTPPEGYGSLESSKTKMEVDWVRLHQAP